MNKKCKYCEAILTDSNWVPSFKKNNNKTCRTCHNKNANERKSKQYHSYKSSIFKKLGDACTCCGQQNDKLLSIDHINGGGIKEKEKHRGRKYMRHLNNLPIDDLKNKYQLLCYNCNYSKGFYGKCPHKQNIIDISHIATDNKNARVAGLKLKIETMKAYGGSCAACGEDHPFLLTLDHINNNGYLEDKKSGKDFFAFLKRMGYPKGELQILCHNCNAHKEYQDLRINKTISRGLVPPVYNKIEYEISKEDDDILWKQARSIFNKNYLHFKSKDEDEYASLKQKIYSGLGSRCMCCGNSSFHSLFVTQKDWEKEKEHRGRKFYNRIAKLSLEDLVKNYTLICHNCNYSKTNHYIFVNDIGKYQVDISKVSHRNRQRKLDRWKTKFEAFDAYGGACYSCGEAHPFHLLIDNLGNNQTSNSGCTVSFLNELKRLNYPKDNLHLLCHNCYAEKDYKKLNISIPNVVQNEMSISKSHQWAAQLFSQIFK